MINYIVTVYDPLFKAFVHTEYEECETFEGAVCRLNECLTNGAAKCGTIDAVTEWNELNEPVLSKPIWRKGRFPKYLKEAYGRVPEL